MRQGSADRQALDCKQLHHGWHNCRDLLADTLQRTNQQHWHGLVVLVVLVVMAELVRDERSTVRWRI